MVFDWFQRRLAKPEPETATAEGEAPATEPVALEASEGLAASDPQAPDASLESTGSASPSSSPEPSASEGGSAAAEPAGIDTDALAWAREAYARLKAEQQAARQAQAPVAEPPLAPERPSELEPPPTPESQESRSESAAPQPEPVAPPSASSEPPIEPAEPPTQAAEPSPPADQRLRQSPLAEQSQLAPEAEPLSPASPTPPVGSPAEPERPTQEPSLSLLERAAAERLQRQRELEAAGTRPQPSSVETPVSLEPTRASVESPPTGAPETASTEETEPRLGAFDEAFTWSAEVLAAQGRRVDQVSLEEIDWLSRLRRGLEKTRRGFVSQLLDRLGDDPLTPDVLDDLEASLLRADVGVQATDQVLDALRDRLNEEVVDANEGLRFLKEQLRDLLEQPIEASGRSLLAPERDRLNIWLMVGVNGVGKTTTLGKLANLAVRSGYSCLIAAADTFRAAAVEQVRIWGERSGVPVISNPSANADPAAVVFDAIGAAKAKGTELVLVDTAGRLQTKHNLMEELSKVRRIVNRLAPEAVVESLLVLDASQGQNGLRQAMAFAKSAGLTGVVITKLDGSSRGGVALAVCREVGLPIRFIGAGEGLRDLRPFNSFEFVEALLAT